MIYLDLVRSDFDWVSTASHSFAIILVVIECICRYVSNNYVPTNLGIIITCEKPLIWDCTGSGALSQSKSILTKLDIIVECYFTVIKAKNIIQISVVFFPRTGRRGMGYITTKQR